MKLPGRTTSSTTPKRLPSHSRGSVPNKKSLRETGGGPRPQFVAAESGDEITGAGKRLRPSRRVDERHQDPPASGLPNLSRCPKRCNRIHSSRLLGPGASSRRTSRSAPLLELRDVYVSPVIFDSHVGGTAEGQRQAFRAGWRSGYRPRCHSDQPPRAGRRGHYVRQRSRVPRRGPARGADSVSPRRSCETTPTTPTTASRSADGTA